MKIFFLSIILCLFASEAICAGEVMVTNSSKYPVAVRASSTWGLSIKKWSFLAPEESRAITVDDNKPTNFLMYRWNLSAAISNVGSVVERATTAETITSDNWFAWGVAAINFSKAVYDKSPLAKVTIDPKDYESPYIAHITIENYEDTTIKVEVAGLNVLRAWNELNPVVSELVLANDKFRPKFEGIMKKSFGTQIVELELLRKEIEGETVLPPISLESDEEGKNVQPMIEHSKNVEALDRGEETTLFLDSLKELGGKVKDKITGKSKELSAKAKEIANAVKENAPWGDIIKKLARTGLSGMGGCTKGALLAVPGAVLMAVPTLGGSAVDLALACGAGFVKKAGPQAAKLIVESIKTTADLVTLDNAIKANEADIEKLKQALIDAQDFVHENLDKLDDKTIGYVNKAISNTSEVLVDLKGALPTLKKAYEEAQQAFKDKKMK